MNQKVDDFDTDLLNKFLYDIKTVKNLNNLNTIKIKYLGRNGIINTKFNTLNNLNKEEKGAYGKIINNTKKEIEKKIQQTLKKINNAIKINNNIDITLPGINKIYATEHIITKTLNEIEAFFLNLGFDIIDGKEIDEPYYNFDALNINKNHPSRSLNETFYLENSLLLRTHTSNMQIHVMKKQKPPIKMISYGKVYRRDSDISHTPMFHQIEGFIIDKNISIANLKFIISKFLNFFFNNKITINMRSSYFPFTEPSMEVDIKCINCHGKKCNLCKHTGWIEVLGCGLIHPTVLKNCNINKKYNGLAFGMGIERLSMIKYQITDIKLFFENNIEFLSQF